MNLRSELAATVFGLMAVVLLFAFASIGLFVRMGPAIERILTRNDATIIAAESMLETLAAAPGRIETAEERERLDLALGRARANITEPGEAEVLDAIELHLGPTAAGDPDARRAFLASVRDLIEINRSAMHEVDREAQRLGRAGAWIAALVGLTALVLCLILAHSLGRRVVRPIDELHTTLDAAAAGDPFRRCVTHGAATELRRVLERVNTLLDEHQSATAHPPASADRRAANRA